VQQYDPFLALAEIVAQIYNFKNVYQLRKKYTPHSDLAQNMLRIERVATI
jgi:hypothetical protein